MKKYKYGLTGEGFTIEEANELLEGYLSQPMTKEEREAELVMLREATARMKANMAAYEEANGVTVTREDLEREMQRQRAAQVQGEPK